MQHQTEHTNHGTHFQKPIILPTGFLTAAKGGSLQTPKLSSEGECGGQRAARKYPSLLSATTAFCFTEELLIRRAPVQGGKKATGTHSLDISPPFRSSSQIFNCWQALRMGDGHARLRRSLFQTTSCTLRKCRPTRTRVQSMAGCAARPASTGDMNFTLHVRVPKKGRREKGKKTGRDGLLTCKSKAYAPHVSFASLESIQSHPSPRGSRACWPVPAGTHLLPFTEVMTICSQSPSRTGLKQDKASGAHNMSAFSALLPGSSSQLVTMGGKRQVLGGLRGGPQRRGHRRAAAGAFPRAVHVRV